MYVDLLPADTARNHIQFLCDNGSNQSRIARAARIARPTVVAIHRGRNQRITRDIHERILRVRPGDDGIPAGHVDVLGSLRRARALIADGHPTTEIAARARLTVEAVAAIAEGQVGDVPEEVARRLAHAFSSLQMTPGTCEQTRRYGAARRWHLPWEWDEDDLDRRRARPCAPSTSRRHEMDAAGPLGVAA